MASKMAYRSRESYWDRQKDSLNGVRDQLSSGQGLTPSHSFQPLSDKHPLLSGSRPYRSNTPPAHLPRLDTPPESSRFNQPASSLRGSKYGIVPPVKPRQAFASNGYDSWGEDQASGSDDDGMDSAPYSYPYPVVMYPMVIPPPQHRGRARKSKEGLSSKKKVHYRDTPTYLNSRDNTIHRPDVFFQPPNSHSQNFPYISTTPRGGSTYDPFDPRSNPTLARYQYPYDGTLLADDILRDRSLESPYKYFTANPVFALKYVDNFIWHNLEAELIPDLLIDVISKEASKDPSLRHSLDLRGPLYKRPDPLKDFLDDIVDDIVLEEGILAVRESVHDLVDEHLERSATYDIVMELATEEVQTFGPDIVREAIFENLVEDIIIEEILDPEIKPVAEAVAMETLEHYDSKARRQEIRELKRHSGNKVMDAFCLQYLLSVIGRQGMLWRQGEQANLLFDSVLLNILLGQYFDVGQKKRKTIDNKPLRRMHEKLTTDVAAEVLLTELCQTLDEDMADLDEYETGLELPLDTQNKSELQRWLNGR